MRKAAGIILIILGIVEVGGAIISVRGLLAGTMSIPVSAIWLAVSFPIVYAALLVTGGVLCVRKKYWELCLTSALLALVVGIVPVVAQLLRGSLDVLVAWENWIVVVGAVISTIFISLMRKEWKEISDSVDGKVSYGG